MTYVGDPTPAATIRWVEDDDSGYEGCVGMYSPPVLVRGAWDRDPAYAATAAAEARAKADLDAKQAAEAEWSIATL